MTSPRHSKTVRKKMPVVRFADFGDLLLAMFRETMPDDYEWKIDNWERDSGQNYSFTLTNEHGYSEKFRTTPEEVFLFIANA